VSGDYIDIVQTRETDVYFAVGDISGKGVAASMLMAKLHAVFRSLVPLGLGVEQLIERASRLFGVSTFRQGTAPLDDTTIMGIRRQ